MENIKNWGLLGSEKLISERRTRTLGLGAAIRSFNELAVPGIGGLWYEKQLFLSALGIVVAETARREGKRVSNIEVANAIEALGCWLAFNNNGWKRDSRLRGKVKMKMQSDLSFQNVVKRSFYVTQPMRMQMVQPLLKLGFVMASGERFNSFLLSEDGYTLIETMSSNTTIDRLPIINFMARWVAGCNRALNSPELLKILSPITKVPKDCKNFLLERLIGGNSVEAIRRRNAYNWIITLSETSVTSWEQKPEMIEGHHWLDLRTGAIFFQVRDSALVLLDSIERILSQSANNQISVKSCIINEVINNYNVLKKQASEFIIKNYDPTPAKMASAFCKEICDNDIIYCLKSLILRDDRVLQIDNDTIKAGPAFRMINNSQSDDVDDAEDENENIEIKDLTIFPGKISYRIHNLYLLHLDYTNNLNNWLKNEEQ